MRSSESHDPCLCIQTAFHFAVDNPKCDTPIFTDCSKAKNGMVEEFFLKNGSSAYVQT